MNPTPQQSAIFDAIASTQSHLCVEAVAGAGKSSTCVEAAKRSGLQNVGFVAFNKHIAEELQKKLDGSATACTLHSTGFRACTKAFDTKLDANKLQRILQEMRPLWFREGKRGGFFPTEEGKVALSLARHAKYSLSKPTWTDMAALLAHHSDIAAHHSLGLGLVDCPEEICAVVEHLLHVCRVETETVDFDDMIWLPVVLGLDVGSFDLLFTDESQDLNPCQQALIRQLGKRLVIVGDSSQAIYGFTGSDCQSMQSFRTALEATPLGCSDKPLTVTFRCPVSHVEMANRIVVSIQARDNAPQGLIHQISPDAVGVYASPGDLVISRTNAPLVSLAYRLIRQGIPTMVRGREIGNGLLELVRMFKARDMREFNQKLQQYADRETSRLLRKQTPESAIQAVEDKVECLSSLGTQCKEIEDLTMFIGSIFSDDADAAKVVLSSIHRAKGLEADRVIVIAPEKLPLVRKDQKEWEIVQEHNLCYIAATRSKRELFFAGDVPAIFGRVPTTAPLF